MSPVCSPMARRSVITFGKTPQDRKSDFNRIFNLLEVLEVPYRPKDVEGFREMRDCLLELDMRSFGQLSMKEHLVMHHDDVKAVNTEENPNCVVPVSAEVEKSDRGLTQIRLPALSWNVITFA